MIALLLISKITTAQLYLNVEPSLFNDDGRIRIGSFFSGGKIFGAREKGGFMLGAGLAFIEDSDYFSMPVFIETGYFDPSSKLAPYASFRIGATPNFSGILGIDDDALGEFYMDLKAGPSFKIKVLKLVPYVGLSIMTFKEKERKLLRAGVSLIWCRSNQVSSK